MKLFVQNMSERSASTKRMLDTSNTTFNLGRTKQKESKRENKNAHNSKQ
jgi:hypothetical protein